MVMIKKPILFIISFVMLAMFFSVSSLAIDIYIDGEIVQYNDESGVPFIKENRTMVPLRRTMESYGANVRWDDEAKTAIVVLHETTVCCPIGENNIYVNGTRIENETGAEIENGRTYLPIRAVLEAFGAKVGYDGNVLIERPEQYSLIGNIESANVQSENYWPAWSNAVQLEAEERYSEAIAAYKAVIPAMLKYEGAVNTAMAYNHLGYCYEKNGQGDFAAVCFEREGELWETAGQHQSSVAAYRKAKYSQTTLQVYLETADENYNQRRLSGLPDSGMYLGVTLKHSDINYADEFAAYTGMRPASGLIYAEMSEDSAIYRDVFERAAKAGMTIQYAIQPKSLEELMSVTKNDPRLIAAAKELCDSGVKAFVRFACEMNDPTSPIFTEDYELYKEKFRYMADIIHEYAPKCSVVWSPNFSPDDTIELYYPGDRYVDYVGISVYYEYQPETDPVGEGKDRNRFAMIPDKIVSLYGHKKPIIIAESGASYFHYGTGSDITDIASKQIYEFLKYIPIKYNRIHSLYVFDTKDINGTRSFELSENETYRNAVRNGISEGYYLGDNTDTASAPCFTYELVNNASVPAGRIKLHSFINTFQNEYSYVAYRINGQDIGVSYEMPYTIEADLTQYKDQTITITCIAFDSEQKICASESINVKVR